ncbi:MAG: minor capsid protein [Coriobacteriia bacterium]|nr:minor capsid protein [Coriobacteriia bacterium]
MKGIYNSTIQDTFTAFDRSIGFNQLDELTLNQVLNYPWSGKNYSQRIWDNTDDLADALSDIMTRGVMTGASKEKMSREVRERFNASKSDADRLIRTESNYFHNQAEAKAYEDMGVEQYEYLATLDYRTSPICQKLDGKRFNLKDMKVGVNFPPMHPRCRSTVIAYFGDEYAPTLRRARNLETGENEVIPNIPYEQWAANSGNTKPVVSDQLIRDDVLKPLGIQDEIIVGSHIEDLKAYNEKPWWYDEEDENDDQNENVEAENWHGGRTSFDNISDAKKYAEEVLNIPYTNYEAMKGSDVDKLYTANCINTAISKMKEEFPGLEVNAVIYDPELKKRRKSEASFDSETRTLYIGHVFDDDFKAFIRNQNDREWWASREPFGLVIHELMHGVNSQFGIDIIKDSPTTQKTELYRLFGQAKKEDLSGYALETISEFLSEAYAEYMEGGKRQLSQSVVQLVKQIIGGY